MDKTNVDTQQSPDKNKSSHKDEHFDRNCYQVPVNSYIHNTHHEYALSA